MKTSHMVMIGAACAVAFLIYRGRQVVPANAGSVLAPAVGAPVAAAPAAAGVGSETSYTTPKPIIDTLAGLPAELVKLLPNGQYPAGGGA